MTSTADIFRTKIADVTRNELNGETSVVAPLMDRAIEVFDRIEFPDKKTEAWKYTPVTRWIPDSFEILGDYPGEGLESLQNLDKYSGYRVVCVNGKLVPRLCDLPAAETGVVVCTLQDALKHHSDIALEHLGKHARPEDGVFPALNTAFIGNGIFLYIPPGISLKKPVVIVDRLSASAVSVRNSRILLIADTNSKADVVLLNESARGSSVFENILTEIVVGAGSDLEFDVVQDRGAGHSVVHTLAVHQSGNSTFSTNHFVFSGALVRSDMLFKPDATGCETHLNGMVVADSTMHVDTHTLVDHLQPDCVSNELFKYILDDKSTGVFNGKVLVRQDSQRINAYQTNRCVMLSPTAHMYAKPELEIYADDVKCSHGATTGQLDEEAVFYLQSRGLPYRSARLLLLEAYALEVVNLVRSESLRELLVGRLRSKLDTASEEELLSSMDK
jgi:Fe-S cluster assembly protein SufD